MNNENFELDLDPDSNQNEEQGPDRYLNVLDQQHWLYENNAKNWRWKAKSCWD
jgi:hypothetical protein